MPQETKKSRNTKTRTALLLCALLAIATMLSAPAIAGTIPSCGSASHAETAFFKKETHFLDKQQTPAPGTHTIAGEQIKGKTEAQDDIVQTPIITRNSKGPAETGVLYQITTNPANHAKTAVPLLASSTCSYHYTDSTQCNSQWQYYQVQFSSSTESEARYRFVDCTTGAVIGRGQICPGEISPKHYAPQGHSVKFELDYYICPNNQCKTESLNLCTGVSCPDYCWTGTRYTNGTCSNGVCQHTSETCPNNSCTNGACQSGCPSGCPAYCSGNTALYNAYCLNSQCIYNTSQNCAYGCSNGTCLGRTCTEGWKCLDAQTRGYQTTECGWTDRTDCPNGCTNGTCNAPTCTNECASGTKRCSGPYSQTCGNYDADACTEWPTSTTGTGNTYCPGGCNASTGNCGACTSHKTYSCYNNDVYWYNSCGAKEGLKQDCGDSTNGTWGANYCKNGDVYHSRTNLLKGCANNACYATKENQEQIVQNCNGNGCTNAKCNAPPTVTTTSYTPTMEDGYVGAIEWRVQGTIKETGVYFAYKNDKSDSQKVSTVVNPQNIYAAMISSKKGVCQFYLRPYATTTTGQTIYADWVTVSSGETCSSAAMKAVTTKTVSYAAATATCDATEIPFKIEEIDWAQFCTTMGYEIAKLVTIGSCIDDGIFTIGCGIDIFSTVIMVVPAGGTQIGAAAKAAKVLSFLADGAKALKAIKSVTTLGRITKKIRLFFKTGEKTLEGTKTARAIELKLLKADFTTGKITTTTENLAKFFIEKGETSIVRLRGSGATNEMLENIFVNGGKNLDNIKYAGNDSLSKIRWVENGTDSWGWQKIWKKHVTGEIPGGTRFSSITNDLSETNIKNLIFNTVKNPSTTIKESSTKYCYFSSAIIRGYRILIIVDKVNSMGGKGTINTAYPNPQNDLSCY